MLDRPKLSESSKLFWFSHKITSQSKRSIHTKIRELWSHNLQLWCAIVNPPQIMQGVTKRGMFAHCYTNEVSARQQAQLIIFCHRFLFGSLPSHFVDCFSDLWLSHKSACSSSLRNATSLRLPRPKKAALKLSPLYLAFSHWNLLSNDLQSAPLALCLKNSFLFSTVAFYILLYVSSWPSWRMAISPFPSDFFFFSFIMCSHPPSFPSSFTLALLDYWMQ